MSVLYFYCGSQKTKSKKIVHRMSSNPLIEARDALHRAAVLERENVTLRDEIYRLEKVNRNLMDHSAQLSQQSRSDVRYHSLETDLAEAKDKIINLEAENTNLVDEKLQLRQQLALLTADNEILSQDIITLSALVSELGGTPGLSAPGITSVEAEPHTAVFQPCSPDNPLPTAPAVKAPQPENEAVDFFLPENRLRSDLAAPSFCESNFNRLLALVDSLKKDLFEISSYCPNISKLKEILTNTSNEEKSKASSELVDSLTRKVGDLENKLCVSESRVTELEVLLADYERQEAAYVSMASEIEDTRKTLAAAEAKLSNYEAIQAECAALREKVASLEQSLTENLDAYKNLDNEYQLTTERLQAITEIAERSTMLEEALRDSETKGSRTAQLLELAQEELARYQSGEKRTLDSAEAEIETLKASLAAKASQLKDVMEQFEGLMELKKKQDVKLNEVYELRKRFDYMRERFEPMQKEVEKLRNKEREYSRILSHLDNGTNKHDERFKEIEARYKQEIARKDNLISTLKEEKLKLNEEIIVLRTSIHVRDEDGRRTRLNLLGASQISANAQRLIDQTNTGNPPETTGGSAMIDKSGITMNDLALQQPALSAGSVVSSAGPSRQITQRSGILSSSAVGSVHPMLRSSTIIGSRGYVGSAALSGIARAPSMNTHPE
ncbi:Chromosome segregation protein SMC [Giardia duodenalis]|uniref:Chromosome segregation protein SMC n=1 Tax=Giardia intestinalis TaxID=5741 RepID=V6TLT1_GIAIN|nr:Chromosome segregation protein SMC [Giardia intestinalis]